MFTKPEVGTHVKVVYSATTPFNCQVQFYHSQYTLEGIVEKSTDYDPHNSFRLRTNAKDHPVSVVELDRSIISINGSKPSIETQKKTTKRVFKVKSDKKDTIYEVTYDGHRFDCSCPGFSFRKNCKHTKMVAEKIGIK